MAKKYVLDEFNNKIEVTDEVGNTTVNEVKCCDSGIPFKMAFVTQAKYNELKAAGLLQPNTKYEITDDTTLDEIDAALERLGNNDIAQGKRLDALEFYNLGTIAESPSSQANSVLDKLNKIGTYTFNYDNKVYIAFLKLFINGIKHIDILELTRDHPYNEFSNLHTICRTYEGDKCTGTKDWYYASMEYVNSKHLYQHNITCDLTLYDSDLNTTTPSKLSLSILKNSNTTLTVTDITNYLSSLLVSGKPTYINASGRVVTKSMVVSDSSDKGRSIVGIEINGSYYVKTHDEKYLFTTSGLTNVVDVPLQIY